MFETRLQHATYWLSSTFLFSAIMNYALAKWIVTSPPGSPAFNEELGYVPGVEGEDAYCKSNRQRVIERDIRSIRE